MGEVEHSVRWRTREGFNGWGYEHALGKVWGFDDIGCDFGIRARPAVGDDDTGFAFVSADGMVFETMRDLFAVFRLRMCDDDAADDLLERVRDVLRVVQHEREHLVSWEALAARAFDGNVAFAKSHVHWLSAERLVVRVGPAAHHLAPSAEGEAVLRMLNLTARGSAAAFSAQQVHLRLHRIRPVTRLYSRSSRRLRDGDRGLDE